MRTITQPIEAEWTYKEWKAASAAIRVLSNETRPINRYVTVGAVTAISGCGRPVVRRALAKLCAAGMIRLSAPAGGSWPAMYRVAWSDRVR